MDFTAGICKVLTDWFWRFYPFHTDPDKARGI